MVGRHNFSANTERTELVCFCELHAAHARRRSLMRAIAFAVSGLLLGVLSTQSFLSFMNAGPVGMLVISAFEAVASFYLLRPLFIHEPPTDIERKTEECLAEIGGNNAR